MFRDCNFPSTCSSCATLLVICSSLSPARCFPGPLVLFFSVVRYMHSICLRAQLAQGTFLSHFTFRFLQVTHETQGSAFPVGLRPDPSLLLETLIGGTRNRYRVKATTPSA
jgi:hypothetical protein